MGGVQSRCLNKNTSIEYIPQLLFLTLDVDLFQQPGWSLHWLDIAQPLEETSFSSTGFFLPMKNHTNHYYYDMNKSPPWLLGKTLFVWLWNALFSHLWPQSHQVTKIVHIFFALRDLLSLSNLVHLVKYLFEKTFPTKELPARSYAFLPHKTPRTLIWSFVYIFLLVICFRGTISLILGALDVRKLNFALFYFRGSMCVGACVLLPVSQSALFQSSLLSAYLF